MTQNIALRGFKTFLLIWFGQLISLAGSGLTGFALGVWVYQRTGSATQFALISLFTTLPGIVFSPIAGALVDRWDRRMAMILSDTGAGLCTLSIALLFLAGRLEVWQIYIVMAVSSTFSAFQWPAYSAATTLLVSTENLGRASGMVQLSEAAAQIGAPVLAGALIGVIQIQGVILIDFATFLFAVFTLLMARVPRPERTAEGRAAQASLLRESAYGWTYIRARPGLFGLLIFFAVNNFAMGIVQVLFTPLVLSFTTPFILGVLLSVAGFGFLAGSILMSVWGGPKQRVYGILGSNLLLGIVLFAAGLPPSVWILGGAAFLAFLSTPITNGCSQAIWQSKTAPDVQGRVFAVRRMIAWASLPLAYLVAGPLADQVFEPLLADGGVLASSIGRVIGVGVGRGIGLLYIILGSMMLMATMIAYLYPRLRHLEAELPDHVTDKAPVAVKG
jgi:DHA3 family macrolide efflux protein-like MFS transporter